jgi:glycosyltransferase involved in cell wall biosynthesis
LADSTDAIKILIVAPFAPRLDATHGGARVTAQVLTNLAKRNRVALVYRRESGERDVDEAVRRSCQLVRAVAAPSKNGTRVLGQLSKLALMLRGTPIWAIDVGAQALAPVVAEVVDEWQPDIVQIEFAVTADAAKDLRPDMPVVMVDHDPGAATAKRALRARGSTFQRVVRLLDLFTWRRFERRLLRSVSACVVFTEADRRALERYGIDISIVCIPFALPMPAVPLDPVGKDPPSILFVGSFIHPPNVDAAFRLVHDIHPRVRAERPDVRLLIVGEQPPLALQARRSDHVIVTGRVDDVMPYLDEAAVVAAPLRLGGGMRVKTWEAVAAGKALVASRRAVSGFDLRDGEQVVVAEGDAEFASSILSLIADPDARARMGSAARMWATEKVDPDASIVARERLYARLLRGAEA